MYDIQIINLHNMFNIVYFIVFSRKFGKLFLLLRPAVFPVIFPLCPPVTTANSECGLRTGAGCGLSAAAK